MRESTRTDSEQKARTHDRYHIVSPADLQEAARKIAALGAGQFRAQQPGGA